MVKKYLWPWIDDIEYGPHNMNQIETSFRFRCTKRKEKSFLLCKLTNITNKRFVLFNKRDALREKRSLFCFAKWQTSQTKDLSYLTKGKLFLITSMHLFEACPNWKCQRVSRSLVVKLIVLVICEDLVGFEVFDKKEPLVYKVYLASRLNQSFSKSSL